jgi:ABC-2 type transport system permease protein
MIPVVNMPAPIQALTKAVPATYFVTLLRGIYLKGVGARILAGEIALLTAFAAAMLLLALVRFKKKLT